MNIAKKQCMNDKAIKSLFIQKCWKYLDDNFHKFSQGNKIKIALELTKKDIPQVVEGEIKYTKMTMITVEHKPLELDLGEDIPQPIKDRMHDTTA